MKDIRPFLDLCWNDKGTISEAYFIIQRNGVKKVSSTGHYCFLKFTEAKALLEALKECTLSFKCHPDFWDTLTFRAKEYGNR